MDLYNSTTPGFNHCICFDPEVVQNKEKAEKDGKENSEEFICFCLSIS